MSNPKGRANEEEVDRVDQYGVFLNFGTREEIDLDRVEKTVHIKPKQAAAMVKHLANNLRKYIFLRENGIPSNRIPKWVMRPSLQELQQLEDRLSGKQVQNSSYNEEAEDVSPEEEQPGKNMQSTQDADSALPAQSCTLCRRCAQSCTLCRRCAHSCTGCTGYAP